MSVNKVILIGRLCADPEFRQTTSGIAVCRIRLAVDRPKQKDQEQQADFVNCTAWRNTAEFISRYFTKGKKIIVEGSLRNNDYTDNNGERVLLVPPPYDMLYVYRLEAEICYKNQEIDRQANALTRYNELMDSFAKKYAREHRSRPHLPVIYY